MVASLALFQSGDCGSIGTAWSVCITSTALAADEANGTFSRLSAAPIAMTNDSIKIARPLGPKRVRYTIRVALLSADIVTLRLGIGWVISWLFWHAIDNQP